MTIINLRMKSKASIYEVKVFIEKKIRIFMERFNYLEAQY